MAEGKKVHKSHQAIELAAIDDDDVAVAVGDVRMCVIMHTHRTTTNMLHAGVTYFQLDTV